jgi:hypothetical protein
MTPSHLVRTLRRAAIPAAAIMLTSASVPPRGAIAQSSEPPGRAARVSAASGAVSLLAAGDSNWTTAPLNYTVMGGDRLNTALSGRAELEIGSMTLRLSEDTDVDVTNLSDRVTQLGISRGVLRLSIYRLLPTDVIRIETPDGAVTVRALGQYRISVDHARTMVSVDNGAADIDAGARRETLRSGRAVMLAGGPDMELRSIARPPLDAFDRWSADRDRRALASACGAYMSRDIPGCADMDEYGRWDRDPSYGTVWYPSHVSHDWVPYRHGHWTHSRVWGWVWVEDEPWGFAPFHYGRWVRVHSRWAWVPGPIVVRPYYAPALVAWVGEPPRMGVHVSIGVHAWFPLGPREHYYPTYYRGDTYVRQVNVTNIVNVTNVTYGSNQRYVNKDVGVSQGDAGTFRNSRTAVARQGGPGVVSGRGYTRGSAAPPVTYDQSNRAAGSVTQGANDARTSVVTQRPASRTAVDRAPVSRPAQTAPPVTTGRYPVATSNDARAATTSADVQRASPPSGGVERRPRSGPDVQQAPPPAQSRTSPPAASQSSPRQKPPTSGASAPAKATQAAPPTPPKAGVARRGGGGG